MTAVKVIISVKNDFKTQEVVDRLKEAGLTVELVLEESGIIIGIVDENHFEALKTITGVGVVVEDSLSSVS